jgi:hypothetical protein
MTFNCKVFTIPYPKGGVFGNEKNPEKSKSKGGSIWKWKKSRKFEIQRGEYLEMKKIQKIRNPKGGVFGNEKNPKKLEIQRGEYLEMKKIQKIRNPKGGVFGNGIIWDILEVRVSKVSCGRPRMHQTAKNDNSDDGGCQ